MQLIQSLGEAMTWFERELQWGVPATKLPHLCGRIGELYAALITNGQMALAVNQKGYDVVSGQGERISVKTTAQMGALGQISFNPRTLSQVDRVIVLRINTEDMQVETLLNESVEDALAKMSPESNGKRILPLGRLLRLTRPPGRELVTVNVVNFRGFTIRELENGSVVVEQNGSQVVPAKPILRDLASHLNISLVNLNGNSFNSRSLGIRVIQGVQTLISNSPSAPHPENSGKWGA
ncbi:hypothetical protein [Pseudomonas sp. MWU12-2323]|uniref:DUF6998 domain-containing protein n=1 Tax=Pseudomonas sp. MWU12-2323 TaxID=2651296 RepID=UPI001C498A72|nr:hypothetical protein [Pseudomonas sp. MWU12-2323]